MAVQARLVGPDAIPERMRAVAQRWRAGEVEYLGARGSRFDWAGVGRSKLWRYEHQYHSELLALAALASAEDDGPWTEDALALVRGWREACPQPLSDAWEPYPVARRVLNWSLAATIAPVLRAELAGGIAAQVGFLSHHLEYHLLGNHLVCDAAALVAGSAVVEAPGMERAAVKGMRLLAGELGAQVLADGGYAERTAQYHAIVLGDVLLAVALTRLRGRYVDPCVEHRCTLMARWLATVARGEAVPYLNDAAPDAAPQPSEVLSLARALGFIEGPWDAWLGRAFGLSGPGATIEVAGKDASLPDTGWSFVREGLHELLFDHGPLGPDEQPGHGHSDALAYELVWNGQSIVIDTGVTTYDRCDVRDFERSARAHATVTVAGSGPDELWAAFRVGARGRVSGAPVQRLGNGLRVLEGVVRSPVGWEHQRRMLYWPGEALVVLDRVDRARGAEVFSHIPLAPACTPRNGHIDTPAGALQFLVLLGEAMPPDQGGWVGRGFGLRERRWSLAMRANSEGRVAYAIAAPGRSVVLEGGSCAIRSPCGSVHVAMGEIA